MAKELGTGSKIVVWVGVIATIGISGLLIHQFLYKPWKAKRDAQANGVSPDVSAISEGLSEAPVVTPATNANFDSLKSALGKGINVSSFGSYITYSTTPNALGINYASLGLPSGNTKIVVKFTNGDVYGVFINEIKRSNKMAEGVYKNGGKYFYVREGKNKGLVAEGSNATANLKKTLI